MRCRNGNRGNVINTGNELRLVKAQNHRHPKVQIFAYKVLINKLFYDMKQMTIERLMYSTTAAFKRVVDKKEL